MEQANWNVLRNGFMNSELTEQVQISEMTVPIEVTLSYILCVNSETVLTKVFFQFSHKQLKSFFVICHCDSYKKKQVRMYLTSLFLSLGSLYIDYNTE